MPPSLASLSLVHPVGNDVASGAGATGVCCAGCASRWFEYSIPSPPPELLALVKNGCGKVVAGVWLGAAAGESVLKCGGGKKSPWLEL